MSECEKCGKAEATEEGIVKDFINRWRDEMKYGISCRCSECERRLNPNDVIADVEGERGVEEILRGSEESEEVKFLQEESLTYGME